MVLIYRAFWVSQLLWVWYFGGRCLCNAMPVMGVDDKQSLRWYLIVLLFQQWRVTQQSSFESIFWRADGNRAENVVGHSEHWLSRSVCGSDFRRSGPFLLWNDLRGSLAWGDLFSKRISFQRGSLLRGITSKRESLLKEDHLPKSPLEELIQLSFHYLIVPTPSPHQVVMPPPAQLAACLLHSSIVFPK